MQTRDSVQVRRLADGSIDYGHYARRGCRMRNRWVRGYLRARLYRPAKNALSSSVTALRAGYRLAFRSRGEYTRFEYTGGHAR